MGCISGGRLSFRGESSAIYEGYRDLFPGSCAASLSNFLRNFWCMLLFAENVVGQGSGIESLVTKKMCPKIIGMRKKKIHAVWLVCCCHSILQSS